MTTIKRYRNYLRDSGELTINQSKGIVFRLSSANVIGAKHFLSGKMSFIFDYTIRFMAWLKQIKKRRIFDKKDINATYDTTKEFLDNIGDFNDEVESLVPSQWRSKKGVLLSRLGIIQKLMDELIVDLSRLIDEEIKFLATIKSAENYIVEELEPSLIKIEILIKKMSSDNFNDSKKIILKIMNKMINNVSKVLSYPANHLNRSHLAVVEGNIKHLINLRDSFKDENVEIYEDPEVGLLEIKKSALDDIQRIKLNFLLEVRKLKKDLKEITASIA